MEASILYLQANMDVANEMKGKFADDENVEFAVTGSAQAALDILGERDFLLLLVDCFITDMKMGEFVKIVTQRFPRLIVNICMDNDDAKFIASIANIKNVTKIFLPPWQIDEIEEGVRASLDVAALERDLRIREQSLEEDQAHFEQTLDTLKEALKKQRFSYYRLANVLKPFGEAFIRISNAEVLSEEDLHSKGNDRTQERIRRDRYTDFVQRACEKMLRVMTTAKLDVAGIESYLAEDLDAALPAGFTVSGISSCMASNPEKSRMGILLFCIWLVSVYQEYRYKQCEISIDSRYLNSNRVEYTIRTSGEPLSEIMPEYGRFVREIVWAFATEFGEEGQDSFMTYKIAINI